jgi:Transposase DDE domain
VDFYDFWYKRTIVPVEIGLVMVSEIGAPTGTQPVEWILSTSLPLDSLEDALQIIAWYCLRWKIEVFHYVLKQGCAIEKLQLETPNALEIAIATYSLLAMQVLRLRALSEKCPHAPMEKTGFEKKDYQIAATFLNAKRGGKYDVHKPNPTVADFAKTLAQLGGSTLQKTSLLA